MESIYCRCGALRRDGQRNCLQCHAMKVREWRARNAPTSEQRRKSNARSYAGVYKRRGQIPRVPCEWCGSAESQMHHDDYDQPLRVRWFCRPCHLELHKVVAILRDLHATRPVAA